MRYFAAKRPGQSRVEEEFVLGPGHGDVEKAALFLEAALVFVVLVEDAVVGEHAFGEPDAENDLPLEALGLVDVVSLMESWSASTRFSTGPGRRGA